ncbi:hypothetical protein SARC_14766, partial [Sphaeroforma arctica JP610]
MNWVAVLLGATKLYSRVVVHQDNLTVPITNARMGFWGCTKLVAKVYITPMPMLTDFKTESVPKEAITFRDRMHDHGMFICNTVTSIESWLRFKIALVVGIALIPFCLQDPQYFKDTNYYYVPFTVNVVTTTFLGSTL